MDLILHSLGLCADHGSHFNLIDYRFMVGALLDSSYLYSKEVINQIIWLRKVELRKRI
jgi:hypothetical protein